MELESIGPPSTNTTPKVREYPDDDASEEDVVTHQESSCWRILRGRVTEEDVELTSKQLKVLNFIDNPVVRFVLFLCTLYALVAHDVAVAWLPASVGIGVGIGVESANRCGDRCGDWCGIGVEIELILTVYARSSYGVYSILFWLDVVATVSLIPEFLWLFGVEGSILIELTRARASRVARAAARLGRLSYISRASRLLRSSSMKRLQRVPSVKQKSFGLHTEPTEIDDKIVESSQHVRHFHKVRLRYADRLNSKLIVGTLILFVILPIIGYQPVDRSYATSMLGIHAAVVGNGLNNTDGCFVQGGGIVSSNYVENSTFSSYSDAISVSNSTLYATLLPRFKASHADCIYLCVAGRVLIPLLPVYPSIRQSSITVEAVLGNSTSVGKFDRSGVYSEEAWLNLVLTGVLVVALILFSYVLSHDVGKLFIRPLQRMSHVMAHLARNPLADLPPDTDTTRQLYLEVMLKKLAGLLRIGFGVAGARIVSQNLSASGDLNPIVPGTKIDGVFGFSDIRNFTEVTEILKEDVMVFVNIVAHVVHKEAIRFGGETNKNIGDAFLCVWLSPDEEDSRPVDSTARAMKKLAFGLGFSPTTLGSETRSSPDLTIPFSEPIKRKRMGKLKGGMFTKSLLQELETVTPITSRELTGLSQPDAALTCYHNVARELASTEFPPSFPQHPKMGYGLHFGWAIQGTVGTKHKVEATYLSPHVNISARLESATKQYGVEVLLSRSFWARLSPSYQQLCRRVDRVTLKGSSEPTDLYTVDKFGVGVLGSERRTNWSLFNEGVDAYAAGDWKKARVCLEHCPKDDGPSITLLKYLTEHNGVAPEGWKGYRELPEK